MATCLNALKQFLNVVIDDDGGSSPVATLLSIPESPLKNLGNWSMLCDMRAGFVCMHILSRWNLHLAHWIWSLWQVLLCCFVKWGVLFYCQLDSLEDLFVCSLGNKYSFLSLPSCPSFFVEAPFILHALPCQTIFDFLPFKGSSWWHNKCCHFINVSPFPQFMQGV